MTSLTFWSLDASDLPFQLSAKFQHLTFNGPKVPHPVTVSSVCLTKLEIGQLLNGANEHEVQRLLCFSELRSLKISGFSHDTDSLQLAPFVNFER